ncbi:MAG TPA: hypothetical protein IAA45_08320 [Candidatus Blautia gallistercoris]|uniref:Uncharacterized protein n=1 Tax=Candidatus Blautia gallistercoris TaxID=2838490 RepID=A0A9D1WIJ0_9FIRM|nr:hypothetical protein [Candidatus Blautia gallistercoris]
MAEHEFADQLFQVLNYNRRMEIATLTIEPFQTPPTLHIQLCSGEKFCLTVQKTDESF